VASQLVASRVVLSSVELVTVILLQSKVVILAANLQPGGQGPSIYDMVAQLCHLVLGSLIVVFLLLAGLLWRYMQSNSPPHGEILIHTHYYYYYYYYYYYHYYYYNMGGKRRNLCRGEVIHSV
jgi:hypothetical protein